MTNIKVALIHDDLMQWGGAERVLLAIAEIFPEAPIYTSIYNSQNKLLASQFKNKKIITSFIQKIPGWDYLYKGFLPLYPFAFEQFDFSEFDLVISQTTRFAKSVITKPTTKHVCYCHTPPRFLWNFSGEKVPNFLVSYLSYLRVYDQISTKRVDAFLAGSFNAQKRIKKVYHLESQVVQPFVDLKLFDPSLSFEGGYYLLIARLNNYKKADVAVKAFNKNGKQLKIVGTGPQMAELKKMAHPNIEFMGSVSEELKLRLLAGCKALVVVAEEDFGLTPLEAQAMGKSVIGYGVGGALETVKEDKTGVFFSNQTVDSLNHAIEKFESLKISSEDCIENAQKFSKERFQERFKNYLVEICK